MPPIPTTKTKPNAQANGTKKSGKAKKAVEQAVREVQYHTLMALESVNLVPGAVGEAPLKVDLKTVGAIELPVMVVTPDIMKAFLGWQTEQDYYDSLGINAEQATAQGKTFGQFTDQAILTDEMGNKVRLLNNSSNRMFNMQWIDQLCQDQLMKNWADSRNTPEGTDPAEARTINGEAMILGRHGDCISIQHRGIALIFADQRRWGWLDGQQSAERKEHWDELWADQPVTIEALVVCGVDESTATHRTIDNVRPRTMADELFSEHAFRTDDKGQPFAPKDQMNMCRVAEYATRLLWHRVQQDVNAYNPLRTIPEMMNFIEAHPRLKDCVRFIYQLDRDYKGKVTGGKTLGGIGRFVPLGTASGLLYMMGAFGSDSAKYKERRHESALKFETPEGVDGKKQEWPNGTQAGDFWRGLAQTSQGKPEFLAVKHVKKPQIGDKHEATGLVFSEWGKAPERMAVLIKAWLLFNAGEELTDDALELEWLAESRTEDGSLFEAPTLDEDPIVGVHGEDGKTVVQGIDFGEPEDKTEGEQLTREELAKRKAAEKAQQAAENTEKLREKMRQKLLAGKRLSKAEQAQQVADGAVVDGGDSGTTSVPASGYLAELDALKETYLAPHDATDRVIIILNEGKKEAVSWGEDATRLLKGARAVKAHCSQTDPSKYDGVARNSVELKDLARVVEGIEGQGLGAALFRRDDAAMAVAKDKSKTLYRVEFLPPLEQVTEEDAVEDESEVSEEEQEAIGMDVTDDGVTAESGEEEPTGENTAPTPEPMRKPARR